MKKLSFLLPEPVILPRPSTDTIADEVKYYSDCVFSPYVHQFTSEECVIDGERLSLNFSFVLEAILEFPKILDNIGVLKIGKQRRYGVLITKEKEGYFLSIID